MATKPIAFVIFSILVVSLLSISLPTTTGEDNPLPSGISDCSFQQIATTLYTENSGWPNNTIISAYGPDSNFIFSWNYSDKIALISHLQGSQSDPSNRASVSIQSYSEEGSAWNYGLSASNLREELSPYPDLLLLPNVENPIVEYVISVENGWAEGTEHHYSHPLTCTVSLDLETIDVQVEVVDVELTVESVGESVLQVSYNSEPIDGTDVIAYSAEVNANIIPSGQHITLDNYWSEYRIFSYQLTSWTNGTDFAPLFSYRDQSSTSIGTTLLFGTLNVDLFAFDLYGNRLLVASQQFELSNPEPIIETCSISYQPESESLEILWNISEPSTQFNSNDYYISVGKDVVENENQPWGAPPLARPFYSSVWGNLNGIDKQIFSLNEGTISFIPERNGPYWVHDTVYWFPLSIAELNPGGQTSEDDIVAQCALRLGADIMLDPVPVMESVVFTVNETLNAVWNSSYEGFIHQLDVYSWQLCWSEQFFQAGRLDDVNCVDIESNMDAEQGGGVGQTVWINSSASISTDLFCSQDCPPTIYAALIPLDETGNRALFGTQGIFDLSDVDGDGVPDGSDAFPNDWNESTDSDGDGVGDNGDVFPHDENETRDSDNDGVGDNSDEFPNEGSQWVDADGDGLGDNTDGVNGDPYPDDLDNDGWPDTIDIFPDNPNEWLDTDGDGTGDEEDEDDDGDGILDEAEIREGSDPKDPNSLPKEPFQLYIPFTSIGIDSWDLMGIFGGMCVLSYIGLATMTREGRFERYMEIIQSSNSTAELDAISKKLEHLQLLRLLGVRHVLRLEQSILGIQESMEIMQDVELNQKAMTIDRVDPLLDDYVGDDVED